MTRHRHVAAAALALPAAIGIALAQPAGDTGPQAAAEPSARTAAAPTAPAAKPAASGKAARDLFGAAKGPAPMAARSIGGYAKGCLAGASPLAIDGPAWQAMRLSRNRNWGHPKLVAWLERFASDVQKQDGWSGLLVGDISQPRGGPMLTGHASHQIGLDADIWFTPMPDRRLTREEREEMSAVSMLASSQLQVDPNLWNEARARIIKRAASSPDVERIFVHPAIKKALCEGAGALGSDRSWLAKVRPYWGHHYHFHVRLFCPQDSPGCQPQTSVPAGDGCGKELTDWLALVAKPPKPADPAKPASPPMSLDALPAECRVVLEAGVSKGVKPAPAATARPQ